MIFAHRFFGGKLQLHNGAARSKRYRYVFTNQEETLFDLINDPGQKKDISKEQPEQFERHRTAYRQWFEDVSKNWEIVSLIPCGYSEFPITHLHAVQSELSGQLKFHGKGFHHDWITNWVDPKDHIKWGIDVVESGRYRVAIKYTCPEKDTGSQVRITVGGKSLQAVVERPYNPDFFPNYDRAPRSGEIEKPWSTLEVGSLNLKKGVDTLTFSADHMPGSQVMEVRKLILERIN